MSSHFDLQLSPEPGALQRLLGVVRRRGFTIVSMNASREPHGHQYHLSLVVEGARCPSALRNHFSNLIDVQSVNLLSRVPRATCA